MEVCAKDVFSTVLDISWDINGKLIFIAFLYKLGLLISHFKEVLFRTINIKELLETYKSNVRFNSTAEEIFLESHFSL